MTEVPVIEARGLVKQFGQRMAVAGLDLHVPAGVVYGFLGPNGSGKSTTIRMLLGLIAPTAGEARLLGHDIRRDRVAALQDVGAQVETPAFYGYLSGRQNMELFGALTRPVSDSEVEQALRRVRLWGREKDKVKTYSQGMRARLGLAQALLCGPKLLVLDEPTNGLDPQGMREVRALILELAHDDGMTVFLSSHLLGEVQQVCDRVSVISHGRQVAEGDVRTLLDTDSETVHIRLACEPVAGARTVLAALEGATVSEDQPDGRLRVALPSGGVGEMNRRLVEAGISVTELIPEHTSLEDFFFDVTGTEVSL